MEEDPTLVFETVKHYMSLADTSDFLRLEALGNAVSNLAYAAQLIAATGIAEIIKIKIKEQTVSYRNKDTGEVVDKNTPHLKYDFRRSPNFLKEGQEPQKSHRTVFMTKPEPQKRSDYAIQA